VNLHTLAAFARAGTSALRRRAPTGRRLIVIAALTQGAGFDGGPRRQAFDSAHFGLQRADALLERGEGGVLLLDDRQQQLDGGGALGLRNDRYAQSGRAGHRCQYPLNRRARNLGQSA
jgi:hypothetical protein